MEKILIDFIVEATGDTFIIKGDYDSSLKGVYADDEREALNYIMEPIITGVTKNGVAINSFSQLWSGTEVTPELFFGRAVSSYINDDEGIAVNIVCEEIRAWKDKFQTYSHESNGRTIPNLMVNPMGYVGQLRALSKNGFAYYIGEVDGVNVILDNNGSIKTDVEAFFVEALVDDYKNNRFEFLMSSCETFIKEHLD